MYILVINAGSSSVKFGLFQSGEQIFKSSLEKLDNIVDGIEKIPHFLKESGFEKIDAVAHRVAHGGDKFKDVCLIDDIVLAEIERCIPLAPLHNPAHCAAIRIAREEWANVPQIAVFDTAFHQTIPSYASAYAIPQEWRDLGVKRYGFHGTSHKYVMMKVSQTLRASPHDLRIISCHLGNGASVCAIDRGSSVDTSMGMTALEGLVMGTRSGDVDPGVFAFLQRELNLSAQDIEKVLYNESGLKALSGLGNDMRDIEEQAAKGNPDARLALQVYAYRARKYIGAYANIMGGFDVLAFTGGIGENSASMRSRICQNMTYLGLHFDEDKNRTLILQEFEAAELQLPHSRIRVMVTQTREQWMIAREAERLLKDMRSKNQTLPIIPIAVSARHVHLTHEAVEQLFGTGYKLTKYKDLSQPGYWAANECVDVIGSRGALQNVRILAPCRHHNQIEITETESFTLALHVPLRLSGDVKDTPFVTLKGTQGEIQTDGVIIAKRHIHMNSKDAELYGLQNGDSVEVAVHAGERDLIFGNVILRVDPNVNTEMHIDTDEANAAHIKHGGIGSLIPTTCEAVITRCLLPALIVQKE